MINSIEIPDQRIGDGAQIQQPISFGIVARDLRRFQAENDTDLAYRYFMGHLGKAVPIDHAGAGVRQVFIDDLDLRL